MRASTGSAAAFDPRRFSVKKQPGPVSIAAKSEIRPMMYLAQSYDHRIIDGREAVTFLVRVKDCIEDPQRLLLEM